MLNSLTDLFAASFTAFFKLSENSKNIAFSTVFTISPNELENFSISSEDILYFVALYASILFPVVPISPDPTVSTAILKGDISAVSVFTR